MVDIVILDGEDLSPKCDEKIILWQNFSDKSSDAVSIPSLIEEQAEEIRSIYLNWIYELGEFKLKGKPLVKHLELHSGISFWWMLPLSEKCNFSKSPHINDAIRLIAFSKWADSVSLSNVKYYGSNKEVSKCIENWCKKKNIPYKCKLVNKHKEFSLKKSLYQFLPNFAQALIWASYHIYRTWPLRNIGMDGWLASNANVTFISYLFNFNLKTAKEGKFESAYWGTLPDNLMHDGLKTNWLHLYINTKEYSCAYAARTLEFFNKSSMGLQNHVALESFMTFSVVFKAVIDWMQLTFLAYYLEKSIIRMHKRQSIVFLWPLFSKEWKKSMAGQIAFEKALSFHLFDSALRALPHKNTGIYLQENQGWEFGFSQAWKKIRHGKLIGFPHSTVRFWDLRYYYNAKCYENNNTHIPMPDFVAINGSASMSAFIESGYPVNKLKSVESLRHLDLENIVLKRSINLDKLNRPIKVLVMGDYLASNTLIQMQLLKKAADFFSNNINITIKTHPANPLLPGICNYINHLKSDDSIAKLIMQCDIAYSSGATSAAVDAFCSGKPLISVLDPKILNLSPLRGKESVYFIRNSQELIAAITEIVLLNQAPTNKNTFFTIDKQLPRWRKIIRDNT